MNASFFDGLDELYHHAKVWEDRTTRAGCSWKKCGVCHCFLSVTFRIRSTLRSRGAWFEQALALPFIGRFRGGFQPFLTNDWSFRGTI